MLFPCLKFSPGTPLHLGLFQGFSTASHALVTRSLAPSPASSSTSCSFHVTALFLPFSNLRMLFHGSLCQGHLPPLGSLTLLTQRCNSVSSHLEAFLTSHLCQLGVVVLSLCSHGAFAISIGAFITL